MSCNPHVPNDQPLVPKGSDARAFTTGATRDAADGKPSFERSLSPLALARFVQYMYEHNQLPNGERRREDNWQKGIPLEVFMDSGFRHVIDWWKLHRGIPARAYVQGKATGHSVELQEAICGVLFNAFGYLHELIKAESNEQ